MAVLRWVHAEACALLDPVVSAEMVTTEVDKDVTLLEKASATNSLRQGRAKRKR